ncbi:hypothetical protein SSX86_030737 [Deinandra increscens subsp. villosa]|uniref:Uncharacterized protein n=1 Tax=Deinandra increscens subsp. villosa TaxID=3103831 RepID=A0AAP0GJE8_9ASTR
MRLGRMWNGESRSADRLEAWTGADWYGGQSPGFGGRVQRLEEHRTSRGVRCRPAASKTRRTECLPCPVVLITASGLQGEQPLVDGTICFRGESGSPRAGRGTDWERPLRGPSPGVEQPTQNCALNVKVKKFNQARVNGGSNYDSLKVAKCLVI